MEAPGDYERHLYAFRFAARGDEPSSNEEPNADTIPS